MKWCWLEWGLRNKVKREAVWERRALQIKETWPIWGPERRPLWLEPSSQWKAEGGQGSAWMGADGLGEGYALSQKQQEGPARFTPKKDMGRWQSGRTKGRGGDFSVVLGAATMARMRSGEWRGRRQTEQREILEAKLTGMRGEGAGGIRVSWVSG